MTNHFYRTPDLIRETARGLQPVPIEDELLGKRRIFLTDEVDAVTSSSLLKQLIYLEASAPGEEITMYINSPGGEVTPGLAVYDYMRLMKSPVRTVCIGTAASMASVLFLAGDTRLMLPHTRIMIHDPSYGGGSYTGKKPDELQADLDNLKVCQKILTAIIAERTGKTVKQVTPYLKKDSYFMADEAIKFGLATGILESPEQFDVD